MILVVFAVPTKARAANPTKNNFGFLRPVEYLGSILVLFLCIFVQYEFRTLISLWLKLDKSKGGMGWDITQKPGLMSMTSGFISMILPLLLTNTLKQKLGIRMACLLLSCLIIIPNTLVPFSVNLPKGAVWACLVICQGLFIALCTIFLSIIQYHLAMQSAVAWLESLLGFLNR